MLVGRGRNKGFSAALRSTRQTSLVLVIDREQIECDKNGLSPSIEQISKVGETFGVEADNLAIEHRRTSVKLSGQRKRERLERLERVPIARHQATLPILNECKRTEAVILQLKEPIRVGKRFGAPAEKHGLKKREHCNDCKWWDGQAEQP
jgi:hypothetical protein